MKDQTSSFASKLRISESLIELMRTQDFHSISITDIVKEADISRATFYRHFNTKEAVIYFYFDRLVERFRISEHISPKTVDEYYEAVKYVFNVIKKNKRVLKIVVRADFGSMILKYIDDQYTRRYRDAGIEKIPMAVYIFSGSIYNLVLKWLDEDCETSSEEMAKIVVSVTPYEFIHIKTDENVNEG